LHGVRAGGDDIIGQCDGFLEAADRVRGDVLPLLSGSVP